MIDSETGMEVDYSAQVETYDRINEAAGVASPWSVERLPNSTECFLNLVEQSGGEVIADLCAGVSAASIKMALERPNLRFVTVEGGQLSIKVAKGFVLSAGVEDRIKLVQGNVLKLPKIEDLERFFGTVDIFERYGLTSHATPRDRERKYWPGVTRLIRPGGYFNVQAFCIDDKRFYDVIPSEFPNGEVKFGPDHFKYPNIYQQFHKLNDLASEIENQGFEIIDATQAKHPRVPEERFVCEIIAQFTGR